MRLLLLALITALCTVPVYAATYSVYEHSDIAAADGKDADTLPAAPSAEGAPDLWSFASLFGTFPPVPGTLIAAATGKASTILGGALDKPPTYCRPFCDWMMDLTLGSIIALSGIGAFGR
ncbi:MAG: hypothetical protein AAF484_10460, partial [Pseudomonadota bacterium]